MKIEDLAVLAAFGLIPQKPLHILHDWYMGKPDFDDDNLVRAEIVKEELVIHSENNTGELELSQAGRYIYELEPKVGWIHIPEVVSIELTARVLDYEAYSDNAFCRAGSVLSFNTRPMIGEKLFYVEQDFFRNNKCIKDFGSRTWYWGGYIEKHRGEAIMLPHTGLFTEYSAKVTPTKSREFRWLPTSTIANRTIYNKMKTDLWLVGQNFVLETVMCKAAVAISKAVIRSSYFPE